MLLTMDRPGNDHPLAVVAAKWTGHILHGSRVDSRIQLRLNPEQMQKF